MSVSTLKPVFGTPAPQSEPILGREPEMEKNAAGGYVFPVTHWVQLQRFLILGTEGGDYYTGERQLTLDNTKGVLACINEDGIRVVDLVTDVSVRGRAAKNTYALFVLAMVLAYGNADAKHAAEEALPRVARTGTHILNFTSFLNDMRGWGRAAKRAVANWYLDKDSEKLALQTIKYRQRDGWSHRDVLRLVHPKPIKGSAHDSLFGWITQGDMAVGNRPPLVPVFEKAQAVDGSKAAVALLREHSWLQREMLPTAVLKEPSVWEALLPNLGMTALLRQLPTLTRHGLLGPMTSRLALVRERLTDREAVRKARLHPLSVLNAQKVYRSGHSTQGDSTWNPEPQVADILDETFELAFEESPKISKRVYVGIDVSGSMGSYNVAGMPALTSREGAAAMAVLLARSANLYTIRAFSAGRGNYGWSGGNERMSRLDITARTSYNEAMARTQHLPFGGTDCALPMIDALETGVEADVFIILTDGYTWAGDVHPHVALRNYRRKTGIPAKLIVVGMSSVKFSIADPKDAGSMDVVGFDASAANVIHGFVES